MQRARPEIEALLAVAVVVLASLTLLPALLGLLGHKVDRLRVLRPRQRVRRSPAGWKRWALGVQRRPVAALLPGVASVGEPVVAPDGSTALVSVVPASSPEDPATEQLVQDLRAAAPDVRVGGATAAALDQTDDVVGRLPLLVGGVVGLSFLLLLAVFRSPAVAVKAAVLNLTSIGAAYGVVSLVLEGGWAGQLVGIDTPTPLPAFVPVLMFAVLFGLSMDEHVEGHPEVEPAPSPEPERELQPA